MKFLLSRFKVRKYHVTLLIFFFFKIRTSFVPFLPPTTYTNGLTTDNVHAYYLTVTTTIMDNDDEQTEQLAQMIVWAFSMFSFFILTKCALALMTTTTTSGWPRRCSIVWGFSIFYTRLWQSYTTTDIPWRRCHPTSGARWFFFFFFIYFTNIYLQNWPLSPKRQWQGLWAQVCF